MTESIVPSSETSFADFVQAIDNHTTEISEDARLHLDTLNALLEHPFLTVQPDTQCISTLPVIRSVQKQVVLEFTLAKHESDSMVPLTNPFVPGCTDPLALLKMKKRVRVASLLGSTIYPSPPSTPPPGGSSPAPHPRRGAPPPPRH